jgi:hypothetical protein
MLYREITSVYFQIHTMSGQNVEFFGVKPGSTQGNHWVLNGWTVRFVITEFDGLNFETCAFMGREVTSHSDGEFTIIFLKIVKSYGKLIRLIFVTL